MKTFQMEMLGHSVESHNRIAESNTAIVSISRSNISSMHYSAMLSSRYDERRKYYCKSLRSHVNKLF